LPRAHGARPAASAPAHLEEQDLRETGNAHHVAREWHGKALAAHHQKSGSLVHSLQKTFTDQVHLPIKLIIGAPIIVELCYAGHPCCTSRHWTPHGGDA